MKCKMFHALSVLMLSTLVACNQSGLPDGVAPIENFDAGAYMGKWYEIARMDHRFERGLNNVSAHYSLRPDGNITVINRGYDTEKNAWREANGKAKFAGDPSVGHLKVSFFGPFYASYVIALLDENYQYALVTGPSHKYMWLLSRQPKLPQETQALLIKKASALGFNTGNLIYVAHRGQE